MSRVNQIFPPKESTKLGEIFRASSYYPSLSLVIDFLPHIQWPSLRQVNKYTKRVVEKKLKRLMKFDHSFRAPQDADRPEELAYYKRAYDGLRNAAPNLTEFPMGLDIFIANGGFSMIRKLSFDEHFYSYRRLPDFNTEDLITELAARSQQLESLSFGTVMDDIFRKVSTCFFGALRNLNLGKFYATDAVLPDDFPASFPSLEELHLPIYMSEGLNHDFEKARQLKLLTSLVIECYCAFFVKPLPPIPQLIRVTRSGIWMHQQDDPEIWSEFFAGAEKLKAIYFEGDFPTAAFLASKVARSCQVQELGMTDYGTGQELDFLRSNCLANLKVLHLNLGTSSLPDVVTAINRNISELECLKIVLFHEPDTFTEDNDCILPSLDLKSLTSLCIDIENFDMGNFFFTKSPTLKKTLTNLELIVSPKCYSIELTIVSLVDEFLPECESLERINLFGFGENQIRYIQNQIFDLGLRKLEEINITGATSQ